MEITQIDSLKTKLSKIGTVQICKDGYVFALLMTGQNLDNSKVVNKIQMEVLGYFGDKYPLIECMRNDKDYFCLILSPKST